MRRQSFIFSGLLHVAVALFAWLGLPQFLREPPEVEVPIVVDLVPIGDKTNPPPKQAPDPQPEPPKPEPAPKPEPVKAETPPPPPKPEPPPPPPPPAPKPPEPAPAPPKPEPKPEPPKPEATLPDPKLAEVRPKPRPQPPADPLDSLLKSVEKPKPKPEPKPEDDLDKLLKAAAKPAPAAEKGNQPRPQNVRGSDAHNPNEPISMTEMDAIRAHVSKHWNIPAGARDADKLIVEIRVTVLPDGTVTDAQIVNTPMLPDSFYTAAADSARRAVRLASPLPIPRNKYEQFKDFVLVFNPKQMVLGR